MANKVPISTENLAYERLDLTRHYLTIDCDFTVYLVLNSSGAVPAEGTDICVLHTGSWQIDAWSLLTKKDFPNQAGFTAHLVWDRTLVRDGYNAPQAMESDIDTANSVSSLKGQPVNITGFSMPEGGTLPVSLFGVGDERISHSNPLPVVSKPIELNMYLGRAADFSLLRYFSARSEDIGDTVRYWMCPKRFNVRSSTYSFAFFIDKFTLDANGQLRKLLAADMPSINVFVNKVTHLYTRFELDLRGSPLYEDPTSDVVSLQGVVPGDSANVRVIEV